jgi:predicted ATP-dependent endonuclease of OLD family
VDCITHLRPLNLLAIKAGRKILRLVNFSVSYFRSITAAHKVPISDRTILIGRNNEGKSNVLKALNFAMVALIEHYYREERGRSIRRTVRRKYDSNYYWETDFPINLQSKSSPKHSIFKLEFELSSTELVEFKKEIGSNLNGTLPLEIRIGKENKPILKVTKKGAGYKNLNSKSGKIAYFIAHRILFNYIPAIRTDKEALSVISDMLAQELQVLEKDQDYEKALTVITNLQKPVIKKLAERIKEPLKEFMPNIKKVNINVTDDIRRTSFRRDFEVIIDDGTPTSIEFKGDGVKSLAALGLLKNREFQGVASIIAIEEPESHLHPSAIHQLNEIICSLSNKNQVIVTTHNPLFVDRIDIKSNIIIEKGKATPGKNISQIRDLLGIKASDNLINANYVLVVEGEDDKIALSSLLSNLSNKIAKAIKNNLLIIDPIYGAGNLSYKLSLLKNELCVYHVLLDHDKAGKDSFEKAKKDGLISDKVCTFITCKGMKESEFEDCIDHNHYRDVIFDKYGVDINVMQFKGNNKWSERIKAVFMNQGKTWDDSKEKEVKEVIAYNVNNNPKNALNEHKRHSIDALVNAVENIIRI